MTMLTQRAVLLAKLETTYGVDPSPSAALDAFLVEAPEFTMEPNILRRNYVRQSISPLSARVGRKLAKIKFVHEVRGNNVQNSGQIADAPRLGRLLRACGFAQTAVSGAATVGAVTPATGNVVNPTWAAGGANTRRDQIDYTIRCVLGGASATAKVRVSGYKQGYEPASGADVYLRSEEFSATVVSAAGTVTVNESNPLSVTYVVAGTWLAGDTIRAVVGGNIFTHVVSTTTPTAIAAALSALMDPHPLLAATASTGTVTVAFAGSALGVVITTAVTAVGLGDSGGTVTPTWAGNLTINNRWTVSVTPVGFSFNPVSTGFESLTLYLYLDGILHKVTGAMGTVSLAAPAGDYGKFTFEFTGQFNATTDVTLPAAPTYEDIVPPQVELAQLTWGSDGSLLAESFTFDMANTVVPRPDVNSPDGYNGVRITSRAPTGKFNPEMETVVTEDFWGQIAAASKRTFSMRIGTDAGNTVIVKSPQAQISGLSYADRNGVRAVDANLMLSGISGDDEIRFLFV